MAIKIDDNGDFVTDDNGLLVSIDSPNAQSAKAEMRCQQNSWFLNPNYGRNFLVWTISQSTSDRAVDLTRIAKKYVTVGTVIYNAEKKTYEITVINQ